MSTFVEIQTDAFANNIKDLAVNKRDFTGVRRPVRGYEIKEDTYAIIKVIRADGSEIALTDAGGGRKAESGTQTQAGSGVAPQAERTPGPSTFNYSNFILQRIDENRQEKQQILETFGETFIFFFGEQPRLLNVTGLLMNTLDFNWRTEFWHNYENILRGTKLVEQNARMYLFWDDIVVEGYMLGANARDDSDMPYHIPFSFNMFVTNHMYLGNIGSDDYPIANPLNIEPLQTSQTLEDIRQLKKKGIKGSEYTSTTEAVRREHERARDSAEFEDPSFLEGATGQRLLAAKNILSNALILGLSAPNLTFLSVANHFFKNRKMRFPRGLAGSDAMAGPPTILPAGRPQRTRPLRSKIRDNVDEYIMSGVVGWEGSVNLDQDVINDALNKQQNATYYDLEKKALKELEDLGIDPVQHPGGSPFTKTHSLSVLGFNPADLLKFGI